MDKHLLHELSLYIEKYRTEDIIIRERDTVYEYTMPMKSAGGGFTGKQEVPDKDAEDYSWLEKFRKKPASRSEKWTRSIRNLSEEEELEKYINKEKSDETFSTKILKYIDRSGLTDAEIYKKAGIDRRHFSKIRCDKYYKPKKNTVIALCIALKLNLNETMDLLQMAGYSLSNCDVSDLIIRFCIERKIYDLAEINEALEYFGQKILGVVG